MRGNSEPGDVCGACSEKSEQDLAERDLKIAQHSAARRCNGCSRPLPAGRYFNCRNCLPEGADHYPGVHWGDDVEVHQCH